MNNFALLFEAATIGILIAAAFFLLFAGVSVVAFYMIRKTVKMALRMVIVAFILLIAFVGSLALWYGISPSSSSPPNRPPAKSTR